MELRQLRYLVRTIELGSISQAALDLGIAQSAVSLQIQRLEGELATRLLQRTASGVMPTDAGIAFLAHAQLALRHAEEAATAAQQSRLSGIVSVGLAPSTSGVLGFPLIEAMREHYPDIRMHLVEGMSGHLGQMLNGRELDLAVLFDIGAARRCSVLPLLEERIFFICAADARPAALPTRIAEIVDVPLVLPTHRHGLRRVIDAAFTSFGVRPAVIAEVDSLYVLMDMVARGMAATLQPWAALARQSDAASCLHWSEITDEGTSRRNLLCSLSDDELSPAALATRGMVTRVARHLVDSGRWNGVSGSHLDSRWGDIGAA
ncbi:MAG TPA: LysR family transcriptional regulator [Aromatoleum sp.]|uniref:LysR family transcriptional regulator n=1 Tax=Aromatoleum sp. TaxID=2307007 RepID=UPI002B4902FE|nr:LysR family transcriptional regulator [Aromatoleum sp.]HJV28764.1 LysR family transcriptional regulator [Aromatoleum sp.]